jgi:hypothetical protein
MDDDLDFDFFDDEPATTEAQSTQRVRLPRRGGRSTTPRRPAGPPRGLTPLLRLLAAIVVLIVLFVVFGLLIQSCASSSKHDAYANYMSNAAKIAHSSQDDGTAVANALTTPGSKATAIASTLTGIAQQEQQNVAQAMKLDPPGKLRPENQQLIEALRLRINGVQGMADALGKLTSKSKPSDEAALLAEQGERLTASDVVWSDLFQVPARQVEQQEGVTGAPPPVSVFVQNRQLFSEASITPLLQRLQGVTSSGGTASGLHGTNLVSVKANPGGHTLAVGSENIVTATTNLSFDVTIEDSGDFQEVGIPVTLTLQRASGGQTVTKTLTIRQINPGQDVTVTFSNVNVSPFFALKSNLSISVKPVSGETKISNNRATYSVIFSLS